jgi:tetratricopeptide (TPR) repeat protein
MSAPSDRMAKLQELLQRAPGDPFLLYGLAMEHKKLSDYAKSLSYLQQTLDKDPSYIAAYHQRAEVYELAGDLDKARDAYHEGIAAAQKHGNSHAAEEMAAALSMIE